MNDEFYREAADYVKLWSSPVIAVLSTDSAEAACLRNSLTFCQLLFPFSKLDEDVTLRDPFGQNHNVTKFQLDFRDLRRNGFLTSNALQLVLTNILRYRNLFAEADIQNLAHKPPNTTAHSSPWLVKYRRHMLQLLEQSEHEFLRCYMACKFVVSYNV
ncbi:unnamed protein product [Soboliphyme baturini]|uniref:SEC63 domain-containing protein n=1 Tax=Soboliphyme baturini TaxID=241478 RepID=A0A183IDX2_9BILA|nr:unnamed protein product [Soboliphyme baturini]